MMLENLHHDRPGLYGRRHGRGIQQTSTFPDALDRNIVPAAGDADCHLDCIEKPLLANFTDNLRK